MMNPMKHLAFFSAVVVVLAGCSGGAQEPTAGEGYRALAADQVMEGVHHYFTADGVRRGELTADSAYMYDDSARADLRGVHLKMFDTQGRETATLTSRSGVVNNRTQAMVARGGVVLVTTEGNKRIETEELHYDPNTHRIWSTVASTLQQNGTRVTGDGFTADDQMHNLQMTHPRGKVEGMKVQF